MNVGHYVQAGDDICETFQWMFFHTHKDAGHYV